jgi:hypothetical protein
MEWVINDQRDALLGRHTGWCRSRGYFYYRYERDSGTCVITSKPLIPLIQGSMGSFSFQHVAKTKKS